MKLYLLRHGLAAELGTAGITRDSERPLTPEGRLKLKRTTAAMQAMKLSFAVILSSPFVRARQTAEIVAQAFQAEKRLQFAEELGCGGDVRELIGRLAAGVPVPESVLLVGHEPDLSELVSVLCSGEPGLPLAFKKGGLCRLSVESLSYGRCATLEWLLTPKLMALMA